jgi:O-antigen/teichoic acid export membrane protein
VTHSQAEGRTQSDDAVGPRSRRATLLGWLRPGVDGRVRALGGLPLHQALAIVRTSGSGVAALFVTSLLGFIFWWVAARAFSPDDVGVAAAAVAAMALLARLAAAGIGTVLAGELAARRTRPASMLVPALVTAAIIAFALGVAFAAVAPVIAPALGPLAANPPNTVGFGIAVALTATGYLLDQASVGLLRGGLQLLRNVAFAVGKLVVLTAAAGAALVGGLTIIAAWVAGEVIALAALLVVVPRPNLRKSDADWASLGAMRGEAAAHHVLNLARFAPSLAMPVIVAAEFSAEASAVFYVAFLLAAAIQPIASSATFTLYAVARRHPEDLARQIRLTLGLSFAAAIPAIAILWLFGAALLGLFGARYAAASSTLLLPLAVLALPLIIKDHWIALVRIKGTIARGALLTLLAMIVEIGGAVAGGVAGGLDGLVLGWLLAASVNAVFQTPLVIRNASHGAAGHRRYIERA